MWIILNEYDCLMLQDGSKSKKVEDEHQENPLGYIDRCLKIGNYIAIYSYYSHYSHYSGI